MLAQRSRRVPHAGCTRSPRCSCPRRMLRSKRTGRTYRRADQLGRPITGSAWGYAGRVSWRCSRSRKTFAGVAGSALRQSRDEKCSVQSGAGRAGARFRMMDALLAPEPRSRIGEPALDRPWRAVDDFVLLSPAAWPSSVWWPHAEAPRELEGPGLQFSSGAIGRGAARPSRRSCADGQAFQARPGSRAALIWCGCSCAGRGRRATADGPRGCCELDGRIGACEGQ